MNNPIRGNRCIIYTHKDHNYEEELIKIDDLSMRTMDLIDLLLSNAFNILEYQYNYSGEELSDIVDLISFHIIFLMKDRSFYEKFQKTLESSLDDLEAFRQHKDKDTAVHPMANPKEHAGLNSATHLLFQDILSIRNKRDDIE